MMNGPSLQVLLLNGSEDCSMQFEYMPVCGFIDTNLIRALTETMDSRANALIIVIRGKQQSQMVLTILT